MTIQQNTYVYDLQNERWEQLVVNDPREIDANGNVLRKITGQLVSGKKNQPVVAKLNIFARTVFWSLKFLGSTETDKKGRFTFRFVDQEGCIPENVTLDIGVVSKKYLFPDKGLNSMYREDPIGIVRLTPQRVHVDFGKVILKSARNKALNSSVFKPVKKEVSVCQKLLGAMRYYPKLLYSRVNLDNLTKEQIRELFVGKSVGRNPADRLMWSMTNLFDFKRFNVKDDGRFVWKVDFSDVVLNNQYLPAAKVVARTNEANTLCIESIKVKYPCDDKPYKVLAHETAFSKGVFIAESLLAIEGELGVSVGAKQRLLELVASNFKKNISERNPLYHLMYPFFCDIPIETLSSYEEVLQGEHALLEGSCLTQKERSAIVAKGIIDELSNLYCDPNGVVLKGSIGTLKKEYYYYLKEIVGQFISRYKKITDTPLWSEVFEFSRSLKTECEQFPLITHHPMSSEGDDEDMLASLLTWCIVSFTWDRWMTNVRRLLISDPSRFSFSFKTRPFDEEGEFDGFGGTTKEQLVDRLYAAKTFSSESTPNFGEAPPCSHIRAIKTLIDEYSDKFDEFYA